MRLNRTRKILSEGGVAVGALQGGLATPEVAKMLAAAGFDWLFLDSEHGPFTTETLDLVIKTCLQTRVTPVVRVPDFQYDLVSRALDSGAEGVMFPRTESADQLSKAISWSKFPPQGIRGFGLGAPQIGYESASLEQVSAHQNAETLVIAQIESIRGLDAIDEIAAVEGLDCLLLGPADMSISLGVPGQWDDPRLWAAIDQVIEACNKAGRWPAIHVRNPGFAVKAIERGVKLVSCGADLALLWGVVSDLGKQLGAARNASR